MARFYIGQPVRCIKGWPAEHQHKWIILPKVGERYTVSVYDNLREGYIGVREVPSLQKMPNGMPAYLLWAESHFAPITDEKVQEMLRVALGAPLLEDA